MGTIIRGLIYGMLALALGFVLVMALHVSTKVRADSDRTIGLLLIMRKQNKEWVPKHGYEKNW